MTFTNKVALITGATSGIGKATARLFAEQGAKVALLGQNQKKLEQTVAEFKQAGLATIPILADVSQDQQVRQGIEQAAGQWGRLDIVFANAGINGVWASLEELTAEDWQQTLDVNLKGTFLTIKHALPSLKNKGVRLLLPRRLTGPVCSATRAPPLMPVPKQPRWPWPKWRRWNWLKTTFGLMLFAPAILKPILSRVPSKNTWTPLESR